LDLWGLDYGGLLLWGLNVGDLYIWLGVVNLLVMVSMVSVLLVVPVVASVLHMVLAMVSVLHMVLAMVSVLNMVLAMVRVLHIAPIMASVLDVALVQHRVLDTSCLVMVVMVWVGDALEAEQLLLETLQLTADGYDVGAAAALEWLADYALFTTLGVEDKLVLTLWQAVYDWVEKVLYISGRHLFLLEDDISVCSGSGDHHEKGDQEFGSHFFLCLCGVFEVDCKVNSTMDV
jgi:hypothetical protein